MSPPTVKTPYGNGSAITEVVKFRYDERFMSDGVFTLEKACWVGAVNAILTAAALTSMPIWTWVAYDNEF
jgi:hypothetical protein